jgi:hypothetical protein
MSFFIASPPHQRFVLRYRPHFIEQTTIYWKLEQIPPCFIVRTPQEKFNQSVIESQIEKAI